VRAVRTESWSCTPSKRRPAEAGQVGLLGKHNLFVLVLLTALLSALIGLLRLLLAGLLLLLPTLLSALAALLVLLAALVLVCHLEYSMVFLPTLRQRRRRAHRSIYVYSPPSREVAPLRDLAVPITSSCCSDARRCDSLSPASN